jgi:hypothetical protein
LKEVLYMRITESRLRRIIRRVILESVGQFVDKSEFFEKIREGIDEKFSVSNDQMYSFYMKGHEPFSMKVNNKSVNDEELSSYLEKLYELHTSSGQYMPIEACIKRMIGFLEAEGLVTNTTYSARKSDADIRKAEMEADPRRKSFIKAFYGNGN